MNLKTLYFLKMHCGFVLHCVLCCMIYLRCWKAVDFNGHVAEASTVLPQNASVNYGKSGPSISQIPDEYAVTYARWSSTPWSRSEGNDQILFSSRGFETRRQHEFWEALVVTIIVASTHPYTHHHIHTRHPTTTPLSHQTRYTQYVHHTIRTLHCTHTPYPGYHTLTFPFHQAQIHPLHTCATPRHTP